MIELRRTVRFCINDAPPPGVHTPTDPAIHNSFSSWPPMRGLGRFYQIHVSCRGPIDPLTGYFISITNIDRAVRQHALPCLEQTIHSAASTATLPLGTTMRQLIDLIQKPLQQTVVHLQLDLTPCHSLTIRSADMDRVIIRQQYEFAAAHRLHVPQLTDEENRRVFGKCNNPSGHGHNYRVEVAVRAPIDPQGRTTPIEQLDAVIDQQVIQRLDHKNLNTDVPQFARLNPSVENIAVTVYSLAADAVKPLGVELEEVSVWETQKTVCTYRPEPNPTPT